MKTSILLFLLSTSITITSCDEICSGGTLHFENNSENTKMVVVIDGTDYGTLDAGESADFDLAEGIHELYTYGVHGGNGCQAPSSVFIENCETVSRECRY